MVLWKLDSHMQKNENGPLSYTIHKNELKKDLRLEYKTGNHKTLEDIGSKLLDISLSNDFLEESKRKSNKSKNKQIGLHQTKKPLHSKPSREWKCGGWRVWGVGGPHVGPGGWWGTRNQYAMVHHPPLPPWLVALICFRGYPAKSRKLKHYKCFTQMKWRYMTHRIAHENKSEFHFLQEHCSGSNQCWSHNQMPINSGYQNGVTDPMVFVDA